MKFKRMILYVIVILLIIFIGIKVSYNTSQKIREDDNLKNKLEAIAEEKLANNDEVIINFEKITDFNWDRIYIITPYCNLEEYAKEQNIEDIKLIDTNISTNDVDNLLVFVLDNKVVSYFHYPRSKGDFYTPNSYGYTPNEAIFKVTENESGWLDMNNIK